MPITKSAFKELRKSRKRAEHNKILRAELKTTIKKSRKVLSNKQLEQAQELVKSALVALDKAAQKGLVKKNNAARRKSRLAKRLAALQK